MTLSGETGIGLINEINEPDDTRRGFDFHMNGITGRVRPVPPGRPGKVYSMGYNIHITRASDWMESETQPISIEEWLAYVASDPEMRLDNYAQVEIEGHVLQHESEGIAVWTTYSGHMINGNMAWFHYSDGQIEVKYPDREIQGKMLQIANRLGAKVQGDEGEDYLCIEDFPAESQIQKTPRRPWWKIW